MTFSIRLQKQKTYKVNTRIGGVELPARFGDLEDFNIDTTKGNNYVMVYNATTPLTVSSRITWTESQA